MHSQQGHRWFLQTVAEALGWSPVREGSQLAQEAWKLFPTGAKWSNTEHGPEKASKIS